MNRSRVFPHVLGIGWVIGSALIVLAPALHHGLSLGPYDLLSQSGLTRVPGTALRNSATGDQVAEMIPWSSLAWLQVHHGHLPLWDSFSGLGLPLAFNWQSGVFSLPTVISYLFPLRLAYTVQIILTMVIAGAGAYVLARVLRVGIIGCAAAGTIFVLSGSFMGWLGYPHAGVMSWSGWLLALTILIVRGRHRLRDVIGFALIMALAVYAGQPEILTMVVVSSLVVVGFLVLRDRRGVADRRHVLRPLLDWVLAMAAGLALGAPLILPGLQVLSRSTRDSGALVSQTEVGKSLPPHDLIHLLVQGYNGLPLTGSHIFGDAVYFDTAAYIGVVGMALAVLGVVRGWRRPEVAALTVLGVIAALIVFAPPVEAVILHLPLVQTIDWHRTLMMLSLCLAVLAGVGVDALVRGTYGRSTDIILGGALTGLLVLLAILWWIGSSGLSAVDASLRRQSLIWPLATGGGALIVVVIHALVTRGTGPLPGRDNGTRGGRHSAPSVHMALPRSAGQVAGGLLLVLETVFLVASGAPIWSSSPHLAQPTTAVTTLEHSVGGSTVGFGTFTCFAGPAVTALGVLPEANSLFDLHEFDFYDPVLPSEYLSSWSEVSHSPAAVPVYNSFCPAITTAAQARLFGISYVLEPTGHPGPAGADFVRTIGTESLYRVPGTADATLTPQTTHTALPANEAPGTPVPVTHPSPSSWRVVTSSTEDQVLRLHLTDEPGWKATIDGHPLALSSYAGIMMQARIPAGHHVIELHYWPTLFTVGLVLAGACLVVLAALVIIAARRKKNGRLPVRPVIEDGSRRPERVVQG